MKTWARAGARSHTRHGSITGSNGKNRSVRPSLLGKDIIDALVAAARTEIEEEVSVPHVSEDTSTKSLHVTISFVTLRVLYCEQLRNSQGKTAGEHAKLYFQQISLQDCQ